MDDPVVIVAARRTPIGSFQGQFANLSATALASDCIGDAVGGTGIAGADISEVLLGCVLPAGVGQAPARQAVLGAGLPQSVPCTTVNKVCGSGMKTVMLAHDMLLAGSSRVVLAGGMESMSNAPYLLPKARSGYRLGHGQLLDHMFHDGLQNPYDGELMGCFAELCADKFGFSRAEQDAYAAESVRRACAAMKEGYFAAEITPVQSSGRSGTATVAQDETPLKCDVARIPHLKPAFRKDGTVTAANSSSISDGAAVLLLMRRSEAGRRGLPVLASIRGHATHARAPEWFTTAPVGAIESLLAQVGWRAGEVDLFEINEAFAVVTMAAMRELALPHERVNVHGGACALGHPIGATGARILVTLVHALRKRGLRRGVASLCIGGGEATAVAIEVA